MAAEQALILEDGATAEQLARAAGLLARGGVVVLPGIAVLRASLAEIRCEVVVPAPAAPRCEQEYRVLVENAARGLEQSGFQQCLPRQPLRWLVVEAAGTGPVQLWPAP